MASFRHVVPQRPKHEGGISNATQNRKTPWKGIVIQLRMYKEKAGQKTKENALVGLESWQ
jgi:hypothetical protein